MTCIIGVEHEGGTLLLADSLGSGGWNSTHRRDGKLHELVQPTRITPGIALGFTSSYRMGQALGYGLRSWAKGLNLAELVTDHAGRHEWAVTTLVPEVRRQLKDAGYMKVDSGREDAGTFLVAVGHTLLQVCDDLQVASSEDGYMACGCGEGYALGAMHAATRLGVERSVRDGYDWSLKRGLLGMEAAMRFSNGVGGRVDVVQVHERLPHPQP